MPKLRRKEKKAAKEEFRPRIGRQKKRDRYPARIAAFMVNAGLIANYQSSSTREYYFR
jgi:hypothetical protein